MSNTTTPAATANTPDLDLQQWRKQYNIYLKQHDCEMAQLFSIGYAIIAVSAGFAYRAWHIWQLLLVTIIFAILSAFYTYKLRTMGDIPRVNHYLSAQEWLTQQLAEQGWKLKGVGSRSKRTLARLGGPLVPVPADCVLTVENPDGKLQVLQVTINNDYSITVHNTPHKEVEESL